MRYLTLVPSRLLLSISIVLLIFASASSLEADTYLQVEGKLKSTGQTIGKSENFLVINSQIPVFIAPFTIYFKFYPTADSVYTAEIELRELGPGFKYESHELKVKAEEDYALDIVSSEGTEYVYNFTTAKDTTNYFNILPVDSLTKFESTHYTLHILRNTLADYYYYARSSYLENFFNRFRKELILTRAGKIDFYILPGSNNSQHIDNLKGYTIDPAGARIYGVLNAEYETVLPEIAQQLIIYENWGYSTRSNVVGFARYFLDDLYHLKNYINDISQADIEKIINDQYPEEDDRFNQTSGSFVFFLVDKYGLADFQEFYKRSRPNKPAIEVYNKNLSSLISEFIDYVKKLRLTEPEASYYVDLYSNQLWFDKTIPYLEWLADQDLLRQVHTKKLGINSFYEGDYSKSAAAFAALAELLPDDRKAVYMHCLALLRLGDEDLAINSLNRIKSTLPQAAAKLAEIYFDKGDYQAAETLLKTIPVYDRFSAYLHSRLALLDDNLPRVDSLAGFMYNDSQQMISMAPAEATGYIDSGYALMLKGLYADAKAEFDIALFVERRPYYRGLAYLGLGRLYDLQGQRDEALATYNTLTESNAGGYLTSLAKQYLKTPFSLK